MARTMTATEFRAKCLAIFDEVAETGETVVVTKRGRVVARVVPLVEPRSLEGTFEQLVSDEELIKPLYEDWEPNWPHA